MSAPSCPDEVAIRNWLIGAGLEVGSLAALLEGFAARVVGAGVRLSRAYIALPSISPEIRAMNLTWRREGGVTTEGVEHDRWPDAFYQSPIHFMLENDIPRRRWRLDSEAAMEGYVLLGELRAEGDTDYIAHIVRFGGAATTALQGVALTACTDTPDGFAEREIALMTDLVPPLALAAYRIALSGVVTDVLGAYVGRDAAARILSGEIRRGLGQRLGAAILFADLSGFTAATETGGEGLVGRLGEHLAAIAEPIEAAGGEVLKFMGDGVLAGFPVGDGADGSAACGAALAAALDALARNRGVNARHPGTPLDLDVALHRGEVFYGNVGGGSRLDFTVIGPAVNEASRIERLCGALGEPLLMSAAFAECCGSPTRSLGRHSLRGVAEPREIFALARETAG